MNKKQEKNHAVGEGCELKKATLEVLTALR